MLFSYTHKNLLRDVQNLQQTDFLEFVLLENQDNAGFFDILPDMLLRSDYPEDFPCIFSGVLQTGQNISILFSY